MVTLQSQWRIEAKWSELLGSNSIWELSNIWFQSQLSITTASSEQYLLTDRIPAIKAYLNIIIYLQKVSIFELMRAGEGPVLSCLPWLVYNYNVSWESLRPNFTTDWDQPITAGNVSMFAITTHHPPLWHYQLASSRQKYARLSSHLSNIGRLWWI